MNGPNRPTGRSSAAPRHGFGWRAAVVVVALASGVTAVAMGEAGAVSPVVAGTGATALMGAEPSLALTGQMAAVVRLRKPAIPRARVYLGAWTDLPGRTLASGLALRQRQLGRRYRIVHHYYSWRDTFPNAAERRESAVGQIPMISWNGAAYSAINSGSQDRLIRLRALSLRSLGRPVFLRWAWEMNGNWFPWDGVHNANSPANYVRAWHRIVSIFGRAGARNVAFVWSPNFESQPGLSDLRSWNNWRRYYPGDRFVDWVAIDGYNFGTWGWWSPQYLFSRIYNDYAGRKPIMIAETSSTERGGVKASWISSLGSWIGRHRGVKAVVWFDTKQTIDWRIDSSARTFRAYRALARSRLFLG